MNTRRWLLPIVVAVALAVGLPARFAGDTASPRPEDRAVLAPLLDAEAPVHVALTDPRAAWSETGDAVGRRRFRPVTDVVRGAVVTAARDDAAAWLSRLGLLLHAAFALFVARAALALTDDDRVALVAGLAAAVAPWALAGFAWPARQAYGLAAVGVAAGFWLVASGRRGLGAGCLALAVLSHELAVGGAVAAAFLPAEASSDGADADAHRSRGSWWVALPGVAAFGLALAVVASRGGLVDAVGGGVRGLLDGATGVVATLAAFLVPTGQGLFEEGWSAGTAAQLGALAAIAVLVAWAWRNRERSGSTLVAVVALVPVAAAALGGGAPFRSGYLLVVGAPLLVWFADLAARAGRSGTAMRRGTAVAAGLWVVGALATSLQLAPALADGTSLIEFARARAPSSTVVQAWSLAADVRGAEGDPTQLEALRPAAESLLASSADERERRRAIDPIPAATVATPLAAFAARVLESDLPDASEMWDVAARAADRAVELQPAVVRNHYVVGALRLRRGEPDLALTSLAIVGEHLPDDRPAAMLRARAELALGLPVAALATLQPFVESTFAAADDPEFELLWAQALADDGTFPELTDAGVRYRYERAALVLENLGARLAGRAAALPVARQLYEVYLHYGDHLVSLDFPAMALLAYERAEVHAHGRTEAAEHAGWLEERNEAAIRAAGEAVVRAQREDPAQVGTAMVELAVAYCRANRTDEADEIFQRLAQAMGGVVPAVRYSIAVHRFGARFDPKSQDRAAEMLAQVVAEDPSITRAHYERGRVLEYLGRFEEAFAALSKASMLGALEEWSIDAAEGAFRIARFRDIDYDPRAIEGVVAALEISPREAHKLRGYLLWRRAVWTVEGLDGYGRAAEHFEAALALDDAARPDFTVQYLASYCLMQIGRRAEARALLAAAKARSPGFVGFRLLESFERSLDGDHVGRTAVLEEFVAELERDPDPTFGAELSFLGHLHLGEALVRRERFDAGLPHLERAREIAIESRAAVTPSPVPPSLVLRIARTNQRLDQHKQSDELVESVLRQDPGNPRHYYNLGLLRGGRFEFDDAAQFHLRAIARQTSFDRPRPKLAYLALQRDDLREARLHLSVYRYHAETLPLEAGAVITNEVDGDLAAAEGAYWIAVATAREELGAYDDARLAYERARVALERALVHAPGCVAALSQILQVLGQLEATEAELAPHRRALRELRDGVEGAPDIQGSTFC